MPTSSQFLILGIDSGFANVGLAVVQGPDPFKLLDARLVKTAKPKKKDRGDLKVLQDDYRRYKEQAEAMIGISEEWGISAIAVEGYKPNPGQGGMGSGAWKTAVGYGLGLMLGFTADIPVFPFWPADLKMQICNKRSASKTEVEEALIDLFPENITNLIDAQAPKSGQEHIYDAVGHAVMGFREVLRLRKLQVL